MIHLALITKKPLVPLTVRVNREKVLNSWDKFRIPKLFSKIEVVYGDPIFVQSKDEIDRKRIQLQEILLKQNKK